MSAQSPRRRRRPAHGGRGGSEPRAVIAAREQRVWHLAQRGLSQREIADAEALSQAAVSKIVQRVEARLARECAADATRGAIRLLAQVQLVMREAFDGWTRSQRERTRKRERRIEDAAGQPPRRMTEIIVETHPGDPRFLREITQALTTAARLRRWLPAANASPPPMRVDLSVLSPEEFAVYEQLHARVTGRSATGPVTPAEPSTPPEGQ